MDIAILCDSFKRAHRMMDLFINCYPDDISKIDKKDCSLTIKDKRVYFVSEKRANYFLEGRRNIDIMYDNWLEPILEMRLKELKRKENKNDC